MDTRRVGISTVGLLAAVVALGLSSGAGAAKAEAGARITDVCAWSACSADARWLRRVLRHAGYRRIGSTGSALTVLYAAGGPRQLRYFWVTAGRLLGADYRHVYDIGRIRIYGDGIRVGWRIQGANVWIEPAPPRTVVAKLTTSARVIPRR
jgi:hypothetical protein